MPKPQLPTETIDFDGLVDKMAGRVFGVENPGEVSLEEWNRLSVFFRNLVKGALAFVEAKTKERFSFNRSVFSLVDTVHQSGGVAELRVFDQPKDSPELKRVCSIPMKERHCTGMPVGSPRITDSKSIPKLVEQIKIDMMDVKPDQCNFRTPAGRVATELKKRGVEFDPHFEIQLKPKSK